MFDFSSLDGNVLLTGKLLNDNHNNNNSSELDVENNQFELNEIKIVSLIFKIEFNNKI